MSQQQQVKHIHVKLEPNIFERFDKLLKDDKLKKQDFFEQRVLEYLEENETQQELDF